MKDISSKPESLRSATAVATLHAPADVLTRIAAGTVEKGNPLEVARVAGIMAAKHTPDIIPLCHPIPLQNVDVSFEVGDTHIGITGRVQLIASTGAEMEALAAVSAAALTLYDMLKPYAGLDMTIDGIRLSEKTGGKSQFRRNARRPIRAALLDLTVVHRGKTRPKSGDSDGEIRPTSEDVILDALADAGITADRSRPASDAMGDGAPTDSELEKAIRARVSDGYDVIFTLGGTGIRHDDRAVEIIEPLLERALPGISEAMRAYGQRRTPYALISRGVAGMIGHSVVITLPGSARGAAESFEAIRAGLIHLLEVMPSSDAATE